MKNRRILERLGDFVLGKGFYIVLFLCVATIGISGYYLLHTMTGRAGKPAELEPAGGGASVVLPDSEAGGPQPGGTLSGAGAGASAPAQQTPPRVIRPAPEQPYDPEPASQAAAPVPDVPAPAADVLPASFTWPVKGTVLRPFDLETLSPDPTLGDWRTHGGLDIADPAGTNVLAIAPGTVSRVYEDGMMGTTVMVDHGGGLTAVYCDLSAVPTVEEGEQVDIGDVIGTVGQTAIAESRQEPHLHLETWLDGQPADPMDYLPEQ